MNFAVSIAQTILAFVFLVSGLTKLALPRERQISRAGYVEDFSPGTIRLIGILEILAAIGLALPALTGIFPWLAPLAAVGLMLTMIGAAITHARRGEYVLITVNVILFALAAFVAYGRFFAVPL